MPPLRQAIALGTRPYDFLVELARELGPVYTLRLPGSTAVVVGDRELVKALWALTPEQIDAATQPGLPINIGENGLILLDGDQHARHRRLLTPPLHGQALRSQAEEMTERARRAVAAWPEGQDVVALESFQDLALDVVLSCALGPLQGGEAAAVRQAFIRWMNGALTPLAFGLAQLGDARALRGFLDRATAKSPRRHGGAGRRRVLPWNRLTDDKAFLMSVIERQLRDARAQENPDAHDVLTLLARTEFEGGERLDDAEIVDEIVTMGVGGVETTANTMAWCLHHLLDHPAALGRVRAELDEVFGEGPVTAGKVGDLTWLGACLDESMRLCPVSLAAPRRLARDLVLGAWCIPAGTSIWVSSIVAHYDPLRWEEPHAFRPERFVDDKPAPSDWFPFGGGRRHCIGRAFALAEMRIVLAVLFHELELERAPGSAPKPEMRGMTVGPSDGVRVRARRRRSACAAQ